MNQGDMVAVSGGNGQHEDGGNAGGSAGGAARLPRVEGSMWMAIPNSAKAQRHAQDALALVLGSAALPEALPAVVPTDRTAEQRAGVGGTEGSAGGEHRWIPWQVPSRAVLAATSPGDQRTILKDALARTLGKIEEPTSPAEGAQSADVDIDANVGRP